MRRSRTRRRVLHAAVLLALPLLGGCGQSAGPPDEAETGRDGAPPTAAEPPVIEATIGRAFAFLPRDPGAASAISALFSTELRPGLDTRARELWFAGEEEWERLVVEVDSTSERLAPWRILPGPRVRLVVAENEALESIFVRDPLRPLELRFGIPLAQWSGTGGQSLRFHRATATLPSGELEGYLLDFSAVHDGPSPARDWIFLQGGEALQAALVEREGTRRSATAAEAATAAGGAPSSTHGAWTRWAVRENHWPEVVVEWTEVRPLERARRDVPVRWSLAALDGELAGELEAVGRHLTVGEGDGPLLPVEGFFTVEGELRIGSDRFEVVGVVRHVQR